MILVRFGGCGERESAGSGTEPLHKLTLYSHLKLNRCKFNNN